LITHVINVHLVRLDGAPGYFVFRVFRKRFCMHRLSQPLMNFAIACIISSSRDNEESMSYKYRVLTGKERLMLLMAVGILAAFAALFYGTGWLTDRLFPLVQKSTSAWLIDALREGVDPLFTPGGAIFIHLASICILLALTALGYAAFSDLGFLVIPIALMLLILVGDMFTAFFDLFRSGLPPYNAIVTGALLVEIAGIVVTAVLVIRKMNQEDDERMVMDLYRSSQLRR